MQFREAARVEDLPPGGRIAVTLEGLPVALFNVEGTIYAIEDRCPHQFAPLNDGVLCGTRLACAWHRWTFELDPGRRTFQGIPDVRRFPVKVEGGAILVDVHVSEGLTERSLRPPSP